MKPDREKVINGLNDIHAVACGLGEDECYLNSIGIKQLQSLINDATELLKAQEPCEDAVSKQTVISALEGEYSDWNDDYNIPITHCIKAVQSIPSVQSVPVARVMSLEKVRQFVYGSPYIIETNLPGDKPRLMWGLYSHQGVSGNFDFAITDGRKRLFDADYGKTIGIRRGTRTSSPNGCVGGY